MRQLISPGNYVSYKRNKQKMSYYVVSDNYYTYKEQCLIAHVQCHFYARNTIAF